MRARRAHLSHGLSAAQPQPCEAREIGWRLALDSAPRTMRMLRSSGRPRESARHARITSIPELVLDAVGRSTQQAPGREMAVTSRLRDFHNKMVATTASSDGTRHRPGTQVNAGRAYARAQLAATAQGLSMQPLSQALQEYPEQAAPYAAIHALLEAPPPRYTVQMWARLGVAPPIAPSPRRGVEAHVIGA